MHQVNALPPKSTTWPEAASERLQGSLYQPQLAKDATLSGGEICTFSVYRAAQKHSGLWPNSKHDRHRVRKKHVRHRLETLRQHQHHPNWPATMLDEVETAWKL